MKALFKKSLKLVIDTVWSIKRPYLPNRILYYHSVHPDALGSHRPEQFKSQLDWLQDHGYHSVLVRDIPTLLKESPFHSEPWVAITFDDGYRDNVEYALPILKDAGFVVTFFVVAGMVHNSKPASSNTGYRLYENRGMMTVQDLETLALEGMEIGSHGMTHRMATQVVEQSSGAFLAELRESKKILEDASGCSVVSFSYPNGQRGAFSDATRRLLAETAYQVAVTTMWGHVTVRCDMLTLPRCEAANTDTLDEFAAKLHGMREYRALVNRIFDRSKVWKTSRIETTRS